MKAAELALVLIAVLGMLAIGASAGAWWNDRSWRAQIEAKAAERSAEYWKAYLGYNHRYLAIPLGSGCSVETFDGGVRWYFVERGTFGKAYVKHEITTRIELMMKIPGLTELASYTGRYGPITLDPGKRSAEKRDTEKRLLEACGFLVDDNGVVKYGF